MGSDDYMSPGITLPITTHPRNVFADLRIVYGLQVFNPFTAKGDDNRILQTA